MSDLTPVNFMQNIIDHKFDRCLRADDMSEEERDQELSEYLCRTGGPLSAWQLEEICEELSNYPRPNEKYLQQALTILLTKNTLELPVHNTEPGQLNAVFEPLEPNSSEHKYTYKEYQNEGRVLFNGGRSVSSSDDRVGTVAIADTVVTRQRENRIDKYIKAINLPEHFLLRRVSYHRLLRHLHVTINIRNAYDTRHPDVAEWRLNDVFAGLGVLYLKPWPFGKEEDQDGLTRLDSLMIEFKASRDDSLSRLWTEGPRSAEDRTVLAGWLNRMRAPWTRFVGLQIGRLECTGVCAEIEAVLREVLLG